MHINFNDRNITEADKARAEAALADWLKARGLKDSDAVAIWLNPEDALFTEMERVISRAATDGWHNPSYEPAFDVAE